MVEMRRRDAPHMWGSRGVHMGVEREIMRKENMH
jgi:hypothetical protein